MRLVVNPDGCFSLGVNIDRDHITVVALDLQGRVRARASQEVSFARPEVVAAFFKKQMKTIFSEKTLPRSRLIGIGVAAPDDLGRVNFPHRPPNYGVWNNVDIANLFTETAGLPVFLENDAAAAAMGELQFGLGLQAPTFFYILISAGLGGGLVIDGNYYRGAQGRSGELGFMLVSQRRGQRKSLQEVVSVSALYEHLAAEGVNASTPDQLTALSAKGSVAINQWIDLAADHLIEPLAAVNCLFNPDAVFLGGRMPPALVDRLAARINSNMTKRVGEIPMIAPVRRAAMSEDASAVGAAILPFNAQLLPSQAALMKTTAGHQ